MNSCPYLQSGFFQDHPVEPALLHQAPSGPWAKDLFPVYLWEDTWFIAASPERMESGFDIDGIMGGEKWVLVRADEEVLRQVWEALNHQAPISLNESKRAAAEDSKATSERSETIQHCLDRLAQSYDHAILLSFTEDSFAPEYWSKNWRPKSFQFTLTTEKPSPFQLLKRSLLPYHGHVFDDPDTHRVFAPLSQDGAGATPALPENVTLVPILNGENLVAAVLCLGNKRTYDRVYLNEVVDAANQVSEALMKSKVAA